MKIRDLATMLGFVDRGNVIREANQKFAEALSTLNDLSAESPKEKIKGKVTLEVDIVVLNGVATVSAGVKVKVPEPPRGNSMFWLTEDGLSLEHPQQLDIFKPRGVDAPAEAEAVSG